MLSKRAKYALNALMELARAVEEGPISAAEIAERAHVPAKFLEAILLDLRKAGMIESRKGRSGGHLLLIPAERINAAEVFRLFDGAIALVPCATHNYYERCDECVDEATCGIRQVFLEVRAVTSKPIQAAK